MEKAIRKLRLFFGWNFFFPMGITQKFRQLNPTKFASEMQLPSQFLLLVEQMMHCIRPGKGSGLCRVNNAFNHTRFV